MVQRSNRGRYPGNPADPNQGAARASAWSRVGHQLRRHPTRSARANVTLWSILGIVLLLIVIGAVAGPSPKTARAANNGTATAGVTASTLVRPPSSAAPRTSSVATSTAAHRTVVPAPVDATGGISVNAAGAVLPDPTRTPGALNAAVTQVTITTTICVSGWTATVRPSSSYTTKLKEQQLASGYAYQGDTLTGDYEEDHLISLELGGSPSSDLNLWPEPYASADGARVKDAIENRLHALVCSGSLSLATAQHAIAENWWTAYLTYVGAAPVRTTVRPPPPASTTTAAAAGPPAGATALCNDGTYSYAAHHQGACSHHGGVAVFYP